MWHPPIMMKHLHSVQHSVPWVQTPYPFQLCNDYFDILQGLCPYDRDMSCQDFCTVCLLRTFPTITPSVSSIWFLLSSTYMLHFLFFVFFVMISLIGNTIVRVLLYSVEHKPLQFPLTVHYLYMSCGASTKTMYVFEDCGQWVSSCGKTTTLFLFLIHLYASTSDAEPGKAYRWRGAPVPCVCWYMYLQTSSQENIVSRPHTLPMSVCYDFHWHHLLRNRCMMPSVVAMQKTVPLCCDLYQMHHVCTCRLATGDTVCWS